MKKLICLLGHNERLMKINECIKEDFENDNRTIRVLKCRYCGKDIAVITRCIKAHFKKPNDFNFEKHTIV